MRTVICGDKSIKVKRPDKDGRVDSRRDGFIFGGTIQLTKIDVSKERLQLRTGASIRLQSLCILSSLPLLCLSPLLLLLLLSHCILPSPFPLSLSLSPPFLSPSPSLSVELIDYVSSIHLSLCRLATGALSGVEGGSFARGGVGRWVGGREEGYDGSCGGGGGGMYGCVGGGGG